VVNVALKGKLLVDRALEQVKEGTSTISEAVRIAGEKE